MKPIHHLQMCHVSTECGVYVTDSVEVTYPLKPKDETKVTCKNCLRTVEARRKQFGPRWYMNRCEPLVGGRTRKRW